METILHRFITKTSVLVTIFCFFGTIELIASASDHPINYNILPCDSAINSTSTASITDGDTKTLVGSPSGGTWTIVSGGGTISGTTYTPDDISTNTDVTIRYTIAADGSCAESTADATFTVADECEEYLTLYALDDDNPGNLYYINIGDNSPVVSTEGDIQGLQEAKDMESLVIDSDGDFYFINRRTYSILYKISRSELDKDPNTPVNAQLVGSTGISQGGGKPITNLTIVNNELYGITEKTEKLYKIDKTNGSATLMATLNSEMIVGGLTIGNDGIVYLLNTNESGGESELWKFNSFPSGDIEKVMDISGSQKVESLATHPNGYLYAADKDNVYKIDKVAKTTTVALSYSTDIEGLAFYTSLEENCTQCIEITNTTATADLPKSSTRELTATPTGGTWSIVSGGGSIATNNGVTTYTPADVTSNTDVEIKYTIAATADCSESFDTVTFTVKASLLGSIGDRVWFDTDGDTNQDVGEPGLEGATVTLDPGTSGNPSDDLTTTTDANGNYLFSNLPQGDYIITVEVNTVTNGVPSGHTAGDLAQNFDADGLGSPSKSFVQLGYSEDNLDQDFGWIIPSVSSGSGSGGGVESESLGDAITKIYVGRKKNSVPTEFVKDKSNRYDKKKLQGLQVYQGKGQTMLDMFPEELVPGDVSHVTSPTDILDYTIADEVLSVDFSLNGQTQGVVLGIKTTDRVYNHTKASCDRLRGAEVLNVQTIHLHGHDFLMQALQQRNGSVEYAISFAIGKNNNDNFYDLQTSWYVNHYNKFNDMYNFQVWSTNPTHTKKLLVDIMNNLNSYIPVKQESYPATPMTFASKIYRDKSDLVIKLRSTETGKNADIEMIELYSETANNIKHRFNTVTTTKEQEIRIDIADGYEYDGLIKIDGNIQDAFYHADGNWGLDFDKRYTEIKNYFVWNDFNRTYRDDELPINRNVELKATSDYDYLMLYKSLLPGNISADYNEYSYLAFTAKGAGMIELGLLKASIQDWKEQYRVMVEFSEEEQTYYVPFEIFTSMASQEKINADDLTTIIFNWLPTDSNSTELDLEVSDVRFVKKASDDGVLVEPIITYDNQYLAYPNPSEGHLTTLLFSDKAVEATVTLHDITGKIVYRSQISLQEGKNEIDLNFNVSPGIMLLNIATNEHNFGTTKIIFR